MSKIGWLKNWRFKLPEEVSFLINELDEKDIEITRLRAENERLKAELNTRCPVDAMERGMSPLEATVWHVWGDRCSDFEPECWTCRAWAEFDHTERLRAAQQWQPIETAPKDGSLVLVLTPSPQFVRWWTDPDGYGKEYPWVGRDGSGYTEEQVRYWIPLPQLPARAVCTCKGPGEACSNCEVTHD